MNAGNLVGIITLLLVCTQSIPAQEQGCDLKLAQVRQASELFGLSLGMTLDQVKAVVPSLQPGPIDDLGFATTSFSPDFNPQIAKSAYPGVRTVTLEFLDNKLFSLWIGFNGTYKWKTLDEFVPGMSAALGLPAGLWSASSTKPAIECVGFEVAASMIGGGPSIRLTDLTAKELWEQRRTEKEEKRSEQEKEEPGN